MELKQLRIGYWYNYKGLPCIMDEYSLALILRVGGEYNWNPIPLTEEWLIKFGFNENGCILLGIDTSFHLLQITSNLDVNVYDINDNFVCLKSIKYVHELQNLYFALTESELKIK